MNADDFIDIINKKDCRLVHLNNGLRVHWDTHNQKDCYINTPDADIFIVANNFVKLNENEVMVRYDSLSLCRLETRHFIIDPRDFS